ncbi:hypothetical protein C8R47DRAFT_440804 [Mycena vitilis]|nr:hypothetical protein C8R47DRAFT_440804 [Mycena vitilis]
MRRNSRAGSFFSDCRDFEVSGGEFMNVHGDVNRYGGGSAHSVNASRNENRGARRGGSRGNPGAAQPNTGYGHPQGPPNQFQGLPNQGPPNQGPPNQFQGPPNHFQAPANQFQGPANQFQGPSSQFQGNPYSQGPATNNNPYFQQPPNAPHPFSQPVPRLPDPRAPNADAQLAAEIQRRAAAKPPPLHTSVSDPRYIRGPTLPAPPMPRRVTMPIRNDSYPRSQYAGDGMLSSSPVQTEAPVWPTPQKNRTSSARPPTWVTRTEVPPTASTSHAPAPAFSSRAHGKRRQTESDSEDDSDSDETAKQPSPSKGGRERRSSDRHQLAGSSKSSR